MGSRPSVTPEEFFERIKPFIQAGDVINFDSHAPWWKIHFHIGYWGIRRHQKRLFGRLGRWRDTHTMLYLADDYVFSVEPPVCRLWKLKELHDCRITVWRCTKRVFSPEDIQVMRRTVNPLVGTKYDIGQLIDFMINEALGYPNVLKYSIFDASKGRKVCSVGVRIGFEGLRKSLPEGEMQRLFSRFKDPAWAQRPGVPDMNTQKRGVDVEATAPGHFANSHFFDDEFALKAEFDNGQQLFPVVT